jgi:hypothetical protein
MAKELIKEGMTSNVITVANHTANTWTIERRVSSDALLVSIGVLANSGDIDIALYTFGADGYGEYKVLEFPTISNSNTGLTIKKASVVLGNVKLVITTSGIASFSVDLKGLSSGELNAKIQGAETLTITRTVVDTIPRLLLPSSMLDRSGMIIKNNSMIGTVYVGTSEAAVTTGKETSTWLVDARDILALDIKGGVAIWCVGSQNGLNLSVIEGG